jgi:ankyrin repeat protein
MLLASGLNVDCKTNDDKTALYFAITAGHGRVVKKLLDYNPVLRMTQGADGETSTRSRSGSGAGELAEKLISFQADDGPSDVRQNADNLSTEVAAAPKASEHQDWES